MATELIDLIKEKRPKLSEGSLKTYNSLLKTLSKQLGGENTLAFFKKHVKEIIEHIEKMKSAQSQKTLLSALFILTEEPLYREKMNEYVKVVNDKYRTQKTDPERLSHLPSLDEIKSKYEIYKNNLKKNPSIENWISFFIVAMTSCVLIPPRRAKDICLLKSKEV